MGLLHASVHKEVLVVNDYLLVKVINLLLLLLGHLFYHVVARDEHRLEVACIRERLCVFDFAVEVGLAVILWPVLRILQLPLLVGLLGNVRDQEVIHDCLGRLFGVLVPV